MDVRWLISLLFVVQAVVSQTDVLFESERRLNIVDLKTVDADEYGDPKNTGSYLFDSSADNNDKKRLALAVMVNRFRSQKSDLFRAHPVFVSCLQRVMNTLQNDNTPLMIISGYKTKSDTGGSTSLQDLYARAGTGAQLSFRPGISGDLKNIAKTALKFCPPLFEGIQRDIGIIMMSDRVHIHMTGDNEDDNEPHFSSEGGEFNTAAFRTWALAKIDEGMDPVQSPNCSTFNGIDSGSIHPKDVKTAEEAVGVVDLPVTRNKREDFNRLVQYLGTNVVFTNPERTAPWCGVEGNPCVDCSTKPAGNRPSKRCANRLMSARMHNFLRVLQKQTRVNIPGSKLKVLKAFDEPRGGYTDYDETSLHVEGRQLTLQLDNGNTAANLKKVTKYAQCIGVDFIEHKGDHIVLAVQKMKGKVAQKVDFQGMQLIAVQPPFEKESDYKLPDLFEESDVDDYPLFDSSAQEQDLVAEDTPLSLFVSRDDEFRYLRLHPLIPKCYSLLLYQHNKFNEVGHASTSIDVVRGFVSTRVESLTIDSFDQRYNTFTLGMAMEIRYNDNPQNRSLSYLAQTAIDKCGPEFSANQQEIGIGLYADRVFVDIRENFDVWTDDEKLIPEDEGTIHAYKAELKVRFDAAVDNRIVDPDDLGEAKKSANVPHKQSKDFRHQTPPHILRQRRAAPDPDDCVPKTDTPFCAKTKKHRDEQINLIWKEVSRKWHYHDEEEVRDALENCLGACGTCMDGIVYENKLENCDNFLHWVPFGLMNENTISNFFPRDNSMLRKHASLGHTIEDAELFHLVVNAVEAVFRPASNMSVEQELYPQAENPSPVMKVLHQLYAIHASGIVKVFVQDDTDISSLREALQVLMLYNKDITSVDVYVSSPGSKDAVDAAIQNLITDMSTTGYPAATREIIAPFTIHDLPEYVAKRDVDTAIREDLIEKHRNWEMRWINREL